MRRPTTAVFVNVAIIVLCSMYLFDPGSLPGRNLRTWIDAAKSRHGIARLLPQLRDSHIVIGKAEAPDTIIEFVDYQCPYCLQSHESLQPLVQRGRLAIVIKQFPLASHEQADEAAVAVICAAAAGRGIQAHDALMSSEEWEAKGDWAAFGLAMSISDTAAYRQCLISPESGQAAAKDIAQGDAIGVHGTPAFVIDGRLYTGALDARTVLETLRSR